MLETLALLVVGWLLGTLSPGITEAIGRGRRRAQLMTVLATELHELRFRLAIVFDLIRTKLRSMDQQTLDLVRPVLLSYQGEPDDARFISAVRFLLESLGDAEYIRVHNLPRPGEGLFQRALMPVPFSAPLLTSHLSELAMFPVATQSRLLRVVSELELFNEHVANVRKAHDRTFDTSLTGGSQAANLSNLTEGTAALATRVAAVIRSLNRVLTPDGQPIK